jgi:hypothetical protein
MMVKAARQKIQNKEDETTKPDDDKVIAEAFDDANAEVGNDSYYADDGAGDYDTASPGDADTDYPPDEGDSNYDADAVDYPPGDDDDSPRVPLPKAQIQRLRQSGARLKYQIGYLNWGSRDHSSDFVLNNIVVTGIRLQAIVDWTIARRELFFNKKPLETHDHRWLDCEDGIPPRPESFIDRDEWENFPGSDKKMDPWSIGYILPLIDESGSLILFQTKSAVTKQAIGSLTSEFDGRRPIVELAKTEGGAQAACPIFKIVGYAKKIDNFDFLRELLITNDPPYVKPKFGDW